jgi:hypothetical protein
MITTQTQMHKPPDLEKYEKFWKLTQNIYFKFAPSRKMASFTRVAGTIKLSIIFNK